MPDTIPVVPIEPTARVLLLHVPPDVASESAVVDPIHTEEAPVIVAGNGLMVKIVVFRHPVDNV